MKAELPAECKEDTRQTPVGSWNAILTVYEEDL